MRSPLVAARRIAAAVLVLLVVSCARAGPDPSLPQRGVAPSPPAEAVDLDRIGHGRLPRPDAYELPGTGPYAVVPKVRWIGVWDRPMRRPILRKTIDTWNPIDQPTRPLVTRVRLASDGTAWFRVLLDEAVRRQAWLHSSHVDVVRVRHRLVVDLSDYSLTHYRDGKVAHRFEVGIGRPEYATPAGTYYIWALMPQESPSGPYGVFAYALNGMQPAVPGGRLGIHGTDDPTDRGRQVSLGCIRVYNPEMAKITRLPHGTPVLIKP